MIPNEHRKKHKRCGTCKYWIPPLEGFVVARECKAKMVNKFNTDGRFCQVYKAKEFK